MFKEKFELQLQKKNVKAYEVSKATGISQGLLSEYKSGKKQPSIPNLQKLAEYFGCPIGELVGDEKAPSKNDGAEMVASTPAEKYLLSLLQGASEEEQNRLVELVRAALKMQGLLK